MPTCRHDRVLWTASPTIPAVRPGRIYNAPLQQETVASAPVGADCISARKACIFRRTFVEPRRAACPHAATTGSCGPQARQSRQCVPGAYIMRPYTENRRAYTCRGGLNIRPSSLRFPPHPRRRPWGRLSAARTAPRFTRAHCTHRNPAAGNWCGNTSQSAFG